MTQSPTSAVVRAVLIAAAAPLTLTACDATQSSSDGTDDVAASAAVEVDTPALRAQKAQTSIEDCRRATGSPLEQGGLPDVTLPCLGGGPAVDLAHLTGTPLVLNYWAQNCGPCRTETPVLGAGYRTLRGEVQFVGVDFLDTRPDAAIAFADELGASYPQLADPDGVTRAPLGIPGLPVTVFVTAAGEVAHVEYGAITSEDSLLALVSEHLGVDAPGGSPT